MTYKFDTSFSGRGEWRAMIADPSGQINYPLFRLRCNLQKSAGFELEYTCSKGLQYLAISHSWTDRTGPGNLLIANDLAPWVVSFSPSKKGLLKWLFYLQTKVAQESGPDLWFWLDLFCIDQSWEDERLFAQQLQQIPDVFANAEGCLALIASKCCQDAENIRLPPGDDAEQSPHHEWHNLRKWLGDHHQRCNCTPLLDAWVTRVWTRQELLYSSNVILCPAAEWLGSDENNENDTLFPHETWTSFPVYAQSIDVRHGLDEFASCLMTWAERHRKTFSSTELAQMAVLLIQGHPVSKRISDLRDSASPEVSHEQWFAFNWAMILNGSIRRTTKARDAIISQMLLLPGYQAPTLPKTMTLQQIAHDASVQFRSLIRCYQLVPLDLRIWVEGNKQVYRALWNEKAQQPKLADVLEAVGSPCQVAFSFNMPPPDALCTFTSPTASLLVYKPFTSPTYHVTQRLDIINDPISAIDCFLKLKDFWSGLSGCAMETRVWNCLQEFHSLLGAGIPESITVTDISNRMQQIVWYMLQGWIPDSTLSGNIHFVNPVNADDPPHANTIKCTIPSLAVVEITYANEECAPHINLLFGDLAEGSNGEILGLGIDKGILREIGLVGDVAGDEVIIKAFGAILAEGRDEVLGSRAALVHLAHAEFKAALGQ